MRSSGRCELAAGVLEAEGGSLEGWESATSFSLLLVTLESCCCVGALEVVGVLWETEVSMRGVGGGIALFLPLVLCLFFLLFILASGDLGRDVGSHPQIYCTVIGADVFKTCPGSILYLQLKFPVTVVLLELA